MTALTLCTGGICVKGMISMILIGALALTLSGCHAPVDAAATAPTQTRETTVPTAAEAPPETAPVGVERPEPEDADFVLVRDYLPDVLQELPYAGTENFTGHRGTAPLYYRICGNQSFLRRIFRFSRRI